MPQFDVFNGDADGICALQQLRLAEPLESTLVTGVKRDIGLLERVDAGEGDTVTVLDISLDKNRAALDRVLAAGARVRYFDHHFPGEIPEHPSFDCHVETLPDKGTSLLVDDFLAGAQRAWAVVGTFGDNFDAAARRAAEPLALAEADLARLRDLGIYINYNGYGAEVSDLHFPPDELYRRLSPYADPLEFIARIPRSPHSRPATRTTWPGPGRLRPSCSPTATASTSCPPSPGVGAPAGCSPTSWHRPPQSAPTRC